MERLWRWGWERFGTRYSWFVYAVVGLTNLSIFMTTALIVVRIERSDRYAAAAAIACIITFLCVASHVRPGMPCWRYTERWAAGDRDHARAAVESTYEYSRSVRRICIPAYPITGALLYGSVAALTGAPAGRIAEYALQGALYFVAVMLIAVHMFVESAVRPVRMSMTEGSTIGDDLPASSPTFATWANILVLAAAWSFTGAGAAIASSIDDVERHPLLLGAIAAVMTVAFAVPITLTTSFSPSMQPLRDLAAGTKRVAAGDYSTRLPVVQDDDLGALAASFNRMQAGLEERRRLASAFGSYVDPALAARLLEQGDDVFSGERVEVTVLFIDIRDFTPFAEANTAEDTVAHLNALFEIVVPEVLAGGGHVNKYLGDGAMAVFGAPNLLADHARAGIAAALRICSLVEERFAGSIRIGIGINTGVVIAGTIGGGGKLEFTLIGDAVNVAARVEQLTKTTGDTVLVTDRTLAAAGPLDPAGVVDRGAHELKGKAEPVRVFALDGSAVVQRVDETGDAAPDGRR